MEFLLRPTFIYFLYFFIFLTDLLFEGKVKLRLLSVLVAAMPKCFRPTQSSVIKQCTEECRPRPSCISEEEPREKTQ